MKSTFTFFIGILVSLSIWAGSVQFTFANLNSEGVDTITRNKIILKSIQINNPSNFNTEKRIKTRTTNNTENQTTEKNPSISPNFLKLFFNFI